jgi:hypothetical protein
MSRIVLGGGVIGASLSLVGRSSLIAMSLSMVVGCATTGESQPISKTPTHTTELVTPRSTGMGLPSSWYCIGHLGKGRQMPSTDCYPNRTQCDSAQIEYEVARTGLTCATAAQAYCTTPATTNSQPTLSFVYTNHTSCFAAPHYCENHRRDQLGRGVPMSECQLIQSDGVTAFPAL